MAVGVPVDDEVAQQVSARGCLLGVDVRAEVLDEIALPPIDLVVAVAGEVEQDVGPVREPVVVRGRAPSRSQITHTDIAARGALKTEG